MQKTVVTSVARDRFRRWYAVAVIVITLLLSAVDRQIMSLLVVPIEADLHISDTQISLLNGIAFVGLYGVATIVVGWLAERYNRALLISLGVFFWSTMTAATGFMSSFLGLLIMRSGVGVGETAIVPAGYSLVGDSFAAEHRGRAMGVLSMATALGSGVASMVGGILIAAIGQEHRVVPWLGVLAPWQLIFITLGLFGFPIGLLVLTVREPRRFLALSDGRDGGLHATVRAVPHLRRYGTLLSCVFGCGFLNAMAAGGVGSWIPTMLARHYHVLPQHAAFLAGAALLFGATGSFVGAALSDVWLQRQLPGGRTWAYPAVFVLSIMLIVVSMEAPTPVLSIACYAVYNFCNCAIFGISFSAIQDLAPESIRPRMVAYFQFLVSLGSAALGPFLIAVLTDHIFADRGRVHDAIMLAVTPIFIVALVLALLARGRYLAAFREIADR